MEDTKDQAKSNTYDKQQGKRQAIKALGCFLTELEDLAEGLCETEFNDFLIEEVGPKLNEDDQLFGTSVYNKMEIAVELSRSELENKALSLENAMDQMNDKAVLWLLDHVWSCRQALAVLNKYRKGYPVKDEDLETAYDSLSHDAYQLQGWLNNHLYDRVQDYSWEIKELRGRN